MLVFNDEAIRSAQKNYEYFAQFARNMRDEAEQGAADSAWAAAYRERFNDALNNDLNTPQALAVALDVLAEAYRRDDHRIWNTLKDLDTVLGLDLAGIRDSTRKSEFPPEVARLIEDRQRARREKNYQLADELRRRIEESGYEVRDTREESSYVARCL